MFQDTTTIPLRTMTHPHNIPSHPRLVARSPAVPANFGSPHARLWRPPRSASSAIPRGGQKRRRRQGKTHFFSSRLKVDVENPWTLRVIAFGHDVLWYFDAHDFSSEAVSNSNRRVGRHNARISSMMIRKSDALQYSKMTSWKIPELPNGGVPSKLCLIARYSLGETHQGINSPEKNWMVCGYKTNY